MVSTTQDTSLGATAGQVLRAMYRLEKEDGGEPVLAPALRTRIGLSNSLMNHHLDRLEERGLIQRVGRVDVGAPISAVTWYLTDDGRDLAETLREQLHAEARAEWAGSEDNIDAPVPRTGVDRGNKVQKLREQVEHLDKVNANLWNRIDELKDTIKDLDDRLDTHFEYLETLNERMQ